MKKIIAVILSLIIALTLSVQTFAVEVRRDDFYPIVIVPGYSSSGLYMNNEDGTKTHVWGIDTNLIIKRVLARSIDLAKGINKLTKGNAKYIADIVGGEFAEMFEHMRCNPDGSSVYDVHTYQRRIQPTHICLQMRTASICMSRKSWVCTAAISARIGTIIFLISAPISE